MGQGHPGCRGSCSGRHPRSGPLAQDCSGGHCVHGAAVPERIDGRPRTRRGGPTGPVEHGSAAHS
eukprot:5630329-Alexandrium_andersonii.AAC.1